jgi:molecular chaperone HscB
MTSYFEVFGLERKLAIDEAALQRRFYELSRAHHPDFHQSGPPEAQAHALELSALVNAAYRALRDPIARVEYLIRLEEGRDTKEGDAVKPKAPPELLEEMFEIQEVLHEARAGGLDDAMRATLVAQRDRLAARRAAEEQRITGELSAAWDGATPPDRARILAAFKDALATRAYLRTVIDDLSEALGDDGLGDDTRASLHGGGEEHVTHHRH